MSDSPRQRQELGELTPERLENRPNEQWVKHMKVIKFTGNMRDNITELLTGMDCTCGLKKDYAQIISAYGDKITRLREDRARYKENFTQEKLRNELLQEQLKKLSKDYKVLEDAYHLLRSESVPRDDNDRALKECRTLAEKLAEAQHKADALKMESQKLQEELAEANRNLYMMSEGSGRRDTEESCLLESMVCPQEAEIIKGENELLRLRLDNYRKVQTELGMNAQEVLSVLREYLSDVPSFTSKQQRDLFLLAKRMNHNLWNRKLEMEVKELAQRKEQVRRMEQQAKRRVG